MGEAYQIKDHEMPYFLMFQIVGWADVFTGRVYRVLFWRVLPIADWKKGYTYTVM